MDRICQFCVDYVIFTPNVFFVKIIFTKSRLKVLLLHLFHPFASKLLNVRRRARAEDETPEIHEMRRKIYNKWRVSRLFDPKNRLFPYITSNGILRTKSAAIKIVLLNKNHVSYIFDKWTHFRTKYFTKYELGIHSELFYIFPG